MDDKRLRDDNGVELWRGLESRLREAFGEGGAATVVAREVPRVGNCLMVVERTATGGQLRTLLCHSAGEDRTARARKFIEEYGRLRRRGDIDRGVLVTTGPVARRVQAWAGAHHVEVASLDSVTATLALKRTAKALAVLEQQGESLPASMKGLERASDSIVVDPAELDRVKLMCTYLGKAEEALAHADRPIGAVDVTGMATGFENWVNDRLYRALLLTNAQFAARFQRRNGTAHDAVARSFLIDPSRLTVAAVENVRRTLELHTQLDVVANVILVGPRVPEELVADLALLAGRVACDSGHIERLDPGDGSPRIQVATPAEQHLFGSVRDRIEWALDARNVDMRIEGGGDVAAVVGELRRRAALGEERRPEWRRSGGSGSVFGAREYAARQKALPAWGVMSRGPTAIKVKVLFLAANPAASSRLQLDEELRDIKSRIRAAEHRDSFALVSEHAVQPDDVEQALLEHRPVIVHFSGHGSGAKGIVLHASSKGNTAFVSGDVLADLLRILKKDIRIVVLNACYSEAQAQAIVQEIDYVVGMNDTIGDDAARHFAASFYRALAFGETVNSAFQLGKNAIKRAELGDANVPKLLVRSGANADLAVL